jgi:integrase
MAADIAEWRTKLPERSAYGIVTAFRQVCEVAIRWDDMDRNPVELAGANPPPPPRGVQTFTLAEVDKIAAELDPETGNGALPVWPPPYGPMIRFAAATGMRPEEWCALERQDIDRRACVVRVARTHVEGRTKQYGKTSGSTREIPLSARAIAALDDVVPRLDTRLVFPGPRGAHVNLRNFRKREWIPALDAAGIPPRRIYDLRSTFASQALAAGVSVFEFARIMGTSVRMIERHYGALLQGSGEAIRGKLDAYLDRLGQESATAAEGE